MPDRHGRTTIVIADDDAGNRLLLRTTLERAGYVVVEARDGAEAVTLVERSRPDLALLDVAMPVLDGFAATSQLRADPRTASLPVILVTALSASEDQVRGANAGATDFVTKPFARSELLARVRACLASAAGQD
ncbi:MAG: response regulator [Candidatus Limnocylindria bacterium]